MSMGNTKPNACETWCIDARERNLTFYYHYNYSVYTRQLMNLHRYLWQVSRHVVFLLREPFRRACRCCCYWSKTTQYCEIRTIFRKWKEDSLESRLTTKRQIVRAPWRKLFRLRSAVSLARYKLTIGETYYTR